MGSHLGAAAALDHRPVRVGADHGQSSERRRVEGQHGFVAQQHDGFGGGTSHQRALLGPVDRVFLHLFGVLEGPGARSDAQEAPHGGVHRRFFHVARFQGLEKFLTEVNARPWHLEVEPSPDRGRGTLGAEPVGNDEAVEAPFVAEDLG